MPLNGFGDFFAGVFGPLMLFWLILGYVQQQKELRQNTKALELQAAELKKSVEQHKELVSATKEQVQADLKALELAQYRLRRESQPVFSIVEAGCVQRSPSGRTYAIRIINSGQAAQNVRISTEPEIKYLSGLNPLFFGTGKANKVDWNSEKSGEAPKKLKLIINCLDSLTIPYTKTFDMELDKNHNYQTVSTDEVREQA